MTEIRLDEEATEKGGAPAELLTRIASRQPYPAGDALVSETAFEFLFASRKRGLQSRRRRGTPEAAELVELGWLDGFGGPSPAGQEIVDLRARAAMSFRASARGGGVTTTWTAWVDGARALVLAEPVNLDQSAPRGDGRATVHVTSTGSALGLLASWMGIGPAWTFPHEPGRAEMDRSALEARVDAPVGALPPVGADPSWTTARAWAAGQWTWFEAGSGVSHLGTTAVRTGDVGWLVPRPLDRSTVQLDPTLPGDVFREVATMWVDSLEGRRRR
jgi:hypothetical protein